MGYARGIEAVAIGGDLVRRVCGCKAPHTGIESHNGPGLDVVLSDCGDVLVSADEPLSPLKSDLGQFAKGVPRKLLGDRELPGDKPRCQLLHIEALPDVFQAPEAVISCRAFHAFLEDGIARFESLHYGFVAPCTDKRLIALATVRCDKAPDGAAQLDLPEIGILVIDQAFVGFDKTGDGQVIGPALLPDQTLQECLILRIGPDLSCAFDPRAFRAGSCRRKGYAQRDI